MSLTLYQIIKRINPSKIRNRKVKRRWFWIPIKKNRAKTTHNILMNKKWIMKKDLALMSDWKSYWNFLLIR